MACLRSRFGCCFDHRLHGPVIAVLVVLGAGGVNRRALFGVQGAVLNGGPVGDPGHLPAQGVDLLDQLALGHAADGRAAGHGRQLVQIDGQQQHRAPHAGGGQGRFAAGVAGADDDDIVFFFVTRHG